MFRLRRVLVVAMAAVAGALTLGCASSQQTPTAPQQSQLRAKHHHHRHHHHASIDEADRCTAHIPGAWFSAQDTPDGARVVYGTDFPAYVRALRDAAHHQAQAPSMRPAASSLSNAQIELPPVATTIEYTSQGAAITYHALRPDQVERVRLLVRWDAAAQRLGNCSILKLPAESMAANQGRPSFVPRASGGGLGEWITNVEIDSDLGATCGLPPDELTFAYDSTEARPRAFPVLRLLAQCVNQGPIAGMKLKVIGYGSPDGDDAFAEQTGMSRAETIADQLTSHGAPRQDVIAYPNGDPKSPGTHATRRAPSRLVVIKSAR